MDGTVVIFVNGILTLPGSAHAWTDRAVTWFHLNSLAKAEKFEYLALPLTRRLMQRRRARNLAELIDSYTSMDVVLVGHSNGCDLICRALKLTSHPIQAVHLFSAACNASLDDNGLNAALESGRLGVVHVYRGLKDRALRFAYWTSWILKPLGLGYGSLGYQGPKEIARDEWKEDRLLVHDYATFGHGSFFSEEVFPLTMGAIKLHTVTGKQPLDFS